MFNNIKVTIKCPSTILTVYLHLYELKNTKCNCIIYLLNLYICCLLTTVDMGYSSLQACINDLEKHGHLIRIKEEVDPYLQMAAIHLRVFENEGPAILFENVKGSKFPAVSNLFGTLDRSRFIFRDTLDEIKILV